MNLSLICRPCRLMARHRFAANVEVSSGRVEERSAVALISAPTGLRDIEALPIRQIITLAFVSIACVLLPSGAQRLARGQTAPPPPPYTFVSFDVPGSSATYAGGIADNGTVVGNYLPAGSSVMVGYFLYNDVFQEPSINPNNNIFFNRITNDGHVLAKATGGSPFLLFAGNELAVGDSGGQVGNSAVTSRTVYCIDQFTYIDTTTNYAINTADGVNNNLVTVGTAGTADSTQEELIIRQGNGQLLSTSFSTIAGKQSSVARYGHQGQSTITFSVEQSPITTGIGINDWSVVVGNYLTGTNNAMYGYINYPSQGAVSVPPPAGYSFGTGTTVCDQYPPTFTFPSPCGFNGINNANRVVGSCLGANNVRHSFSMFDDQFVIFDPPGAASSYATSINNNNAVVGTWVDLKGQTHGYIAIPNNSTTESMKISPKVKTKPLIGKYFVDVVPAPPTKRVSVKTSQVR